MRSGVATAALGLLPAAVVAGALGFGARAWWVAILGYHLACVLVPAVARLGAADAGLAPVDLRRWIVPTATLSVVLAAGSWIGGVWAYRQGWVPEAARALLFKVEPWWLFVAWSVALNPFLEEYYWRGFLLRRSGVLAGASLFGFMHLAAFAMVLPALQALPLCLPVTAAGVLWGWLRRRFESLWPCIVTHLAADVGILAVFATLRK